jgi:hypothetical protein
MGLRIFCDKVGKIVKYSIRAPECTFFYNSFKQVLKFDQIQYWTAFRRSAMAQVKAGGSILCIKKNIIHNASKIDYEQLFLRTDGKLIRIHKFIIQGT